MNPYDEYNLNQEVFDDPMTVEEEIEQEEEFWDSLIN